MTEKSIESDVTSSYRFKDDVTFKGSQSNCLTRSIANQSISSFDESNDEEAYDYSDGIIES